MLIRLGYDMSFDVPFEVPIVALLNVYPSRTEDLLEPDVLKLEPEVPIETYMDSFGNQCSRFVAPPGTIRLYSSTLIQDSGKLDAEDPEAEEIPVKDLPADVLRYLLPSRYCEVDLLTSLAADLFGDLPPGWGRVKAVCDWVYSRVTFGYNFARPTKTALNVFTERTGVCRDFQHLAVALCRGLNIPARYVTGYLGDIGVPISPSPMDFSAWFEAYLGGRWWTFDARHNTSRIGRVLMAVGRDAADVALTTSFGSARLLNFTVVAEELREATPAAAS
ncbi:MAG: transglutaminase family protein [Bryobacteraceae bacterium]